MSSHTAIISPDSSFDMAGVEYVEGYDDPGANVVFVCFDKKAFRIHDYFLKAESILFREMFQDGTQHGSIGIDEDSWQMHFIFDRITKKPFNEFDSHLARNAKYCDHILSRFIALEPICRKYMFDSVRDLLHRLIGLFSGDCPPQALAFAMQCDPPDAIVAKAALRQFKDLMFARGRGDDMKPYFVSGQIASLPSHPDYRRYYSPTPYNLSWSFVNEGLGLKAYYAYSRALKGNSKAEGSWNWNAVASEFLRIMEISVPRIPI